MIIYNDKLFLSSMSFIFLSHTFQLLIITYLSMYKILFFNNSIYIFSITSENEVNETMQNQK